MLTYSRLLELAGRPRLILEAMTPREATNIFAHHGVDVTGMSDANLKAAYRKLAVRVHPDRGGDLKASQEVNAAYDILKTGARGTASADPFTTSNHTQGHPQGKPMSGREGAKQRAEAGKPDFRRIDDIYYHFETKMAGSDWASRGKWTVMGFDGTFTRHQFSVVASPALFGEMARCMVIWQTKGANSYPCRAVFAMNERDPLKTLHVIWANGQDLDPPIEIPGEEDDDGRVPMIYNDRRAMERLPGIIAAEMAKRGA
jgi:hypothetical protein